MARSANLRILDHNGNNIPRSAYATAYEGAAYGRRLNTWGTSSIGPNSALFSSLSSLRSRSRELARNDPLVAGGIDALIANLIGTGITPRWQIESSNIKKEIQQLWNDWVFEADVDGIYDFYGLQSLIARAVIEGAEALIRFRPQRPGAGLTVPLQLQVLEGDHLDATYNTLAPRSQNEIRMGIEFDKKGKRVAYWLFKEHPGESFITTTHDSTTRIRVPASEILHIFRPLRLGQKRGTPWLSSIIVTQHETNQFDDAEIVRKKGAAMFGGYITESEGDSTDFPRIGKKVDDDSQGREVVAMEPGTFPVLPVGMDVRFSEPADVGGNYEAFTKRQDRRAAKGMGLTYEKFTGDLEGVNYSSIRAGNLEFQRLCKQIIYNVLVFQLCRPVAIKWLDQAVLAQSIDLADYMAGRRKYHRIKWDIDGWDWVDPKKDVEAKKESVRCGFETRSQVVGEKGHDSEAVDEEMADDNKRADKLGLIYDSDPRKTENKGKTQGPKDEEGEEDE